MHSNDWVKCEMKYKVYECMFKLLKVRITYLNILHINSILNINILRTTKQDSCFKVVADNEKNYITQFVKGDHQELHYIIFRGNHQELQYTICQGEPW